jgi:hypothetical protein
MFLMLRNFAHYDFPPTASFAWLIFYRLFPGLTLAKARSLILRNSSPNNAFVRVTAKLAKNSKEAEQPVPPILVHVLTVLKAHARPNARR